MHSEREAISLSLKNCFCDGEVASGLLRHVLFSAIHPVIHTDCSAPRETAVRFGALLLTVDWIDGKLRLAVPALVLTARPPEPTTQQCSRKSERRRL